MKFATLKNGVANFSGGLLPAIVTLFTTPFVVNTMGDTSYGVLVLITAIAGYFAFLDLNFTSGSVKFIAQYQASGDVRSRDQMLVCGLFLYAAIGALGCVLILGFADPLLEHFFRVPETMLQDSKRALQWAAFGFLFGQMQTYLNSTVQALQRYGRTALFETLFGVLAPLSTVVVLVMGLGLVEVVMVRVIVSIAHGLLLFRTLQALMPDAAIVRPTKDTFMRLGKFSSYAYLSRLASVAYAQGDKLILAAFTTMQQVTQYAIPLMLVSRLFSMTYRFAGVLFPVASALSAKDENERLREIYLYAARYVFFFNSILASLLVTLAYELLLHWIGQEMATASAVVLIILALASLVDSLTNAPSLVNDGLGHPQVTGSFALSRALVGVALAFILIQSVGMVGAAWAQLTTSLVMTALFLAYVHPRTIPVALLTYLRVVIAPTLPIAALAVSVAVVRSGASPFSLFETAGFVVASLVALAVYALVVVVRPADRRALQGRMMAFMKAARS